MYMKAMSSATADRNKAALCLHISRFISGSCDRATAREPVNRRFAGVHCEIERHAMLAHKQKYFCQINRRCFYMGGKNEKDTSEH